VTVLRSAVFNLLFLGGTVLTVVFGLPLLAAPSRFMIAYVRVWSRLMVFLLRAVCRIRVEVSGMEHIPPGGAIIAAKHQSAFDTVIWVKLLEAPVYIMKKELRQIPLWGLLALKCGHVEVDREAGAAALRGMVRGAQAALRAGRPVVIFPEGTRSAPGERVPYQPGVAALAIASGAPVVPVATDSGRFWGRRAFHKRPGTLHVAVLPPLPAGLPRAALMALLEETIEGATARLLAPGEPVDKSGDRDSVISDSSRESTPPKP
jgi:1-acyl-sn-glycerol-3-phosphate acyltransferase